MKIHQLIGGVSIPVTNEEQDFIDKHGSVKLTSLDERDAWLAQNLVRKGIYDVSNDNVTLSKKTNEKHTK
jgi:hypothetical protein